VKTQFLGLTRPRSFRNGCVETILNDVKEFLSFELTDLKEFTLKVLHLTLQAVCIQIDPVAVKLSGNVVVGCL
jgi:hypothetical protein